MGDYACVKTLERDGSINTTVVPYKWVDTKKQIVHWSNSLNAKQDYKNLADIDSKWPTFKLIKLIVTGGNFI